MLQPTNTPPNVVVSCTAPLLGTTAFVAIAASSQPRCGAGSAARPVFSCQSLSRLFWDSFFAALAPAPTHFVLVVTNMTRTETTSFGLSFSLCLGPLGCLTREPAVRTIALPEMEWLTPNAVSAGRQPDGSVLLKKVRDYGTGYCSAKIPVSGRSGYLVNANWLLTNEFTQPRGMTGGRSMGIYSIGAWTSQSSNPQPNGASTPRVDLRVSSDFVRVPIPGYEYDGAYCRMAFNKIVPDEVLLISRNGPPGIELTVADVAVTHKSKRMAVVASVRVPTLGPRFTGAQAAVTRKKNGEVVFILYDRGMKNLYMTDCSDLVAVESTTGRVTHLTGECSELTQVSTSVVCAWCQPTMSYQLWDCNNLARPLRGIHCDDGFDQVVGGRGFLFAVSRGKILVIEALSGVVVFTFDVYSAGSLSITTRCCLLS